MAHSLLKICGLTNLADLRLAQGIGADYLGCVVEAPGSLRSVPLAVARRLLRVAPEQLVTVTISEDPDFLYRLAHDLHPRAVQVHAVLPVELLHNLMQYCPIWPVVSLPAADDSQDGAWEEALRQVRQAAELGAELLVLDTIKAGRSGGTGEVSNWSLAAKVVAQSAVPVLLAGGIRPENACEALQMVHPAGLDCSTRLERSPGRKDPHKLWQLRAAIAAADV